MLLIHSTKIYKNPVRESFANVTSSHPSSMRRMLLQENTRERGKRIVTHHEGLHPQELK